ncbi:VIT1/CCC1 transporter family protein [Candidatus Amesbacteria bacterium]|nr:VIT1/CCC1 transporter family protein [Candidatus Amesbacteria bacterium]
MDSAYVRNFTFGAEDGLSSTVGLLAGIASASVPQTTIIITGLILIFTEAMSMGVGSFLTEQSVSEFKTRRDLPLSKSIPGAVIMFFSYFITGLIPLFPYVVFSTPLNLWTSIALSLMSLSFLGFINARLSRTSIWHHASRMLILGGSVAVSGVLLGRFLNSFA